MKTQPNTPGGWMDFVSKVKELRLESGNSHPLDANLYSIMMREYYIIGRSPADFVNRKK